MCVAKISRFTLERTLKWTRRCDPRALHDLAALSGSRAYFPILSSVNERWTMVKLCWLLGTRRTPNFNSTIFSPISWQKAKTNNTRRWRINRWIEIGRNERFLANLLCGWNWKKFGKITFGLLPQRWFNLERNQIWCVAVTLTASAATQRKRQPKRMPYECQSGVEHSFVVVVAWNVQFSPLFKYSCFIWKIWPGILPSQSSVVGARMAWLAVALTPKQLTAK